jgi:hypothetical protein
MPTATTLPLIILLAFLWRYTKGQILPIVLFTSIFEAASAINLGAVGVAPWLFALGFSLMLKMLRGFRAFRFTAGANPIALHLFIILVGYFLWTGLAYPFLFRGAPVMHGALSTPLSWSSSNLAQSCYLVAVAGLYFIAVSSSREELRVAIDWYVRGCVIAAVFAMYQLANALVHIPYPDAILYSNPSYMIYRAYMIHGMWRLNSTFPEASELATYMTVGLGILGWTLMTHPVRFGRIVCFIFMLCALLLTVSSLGYATLIFIFISGAALYSRYIFIRKGIPPAKLVIALMLVLGFTALFALSVSARHTVDKVITSTLLEKKDSQSYRERTGTHVAALETLSRTYYMGAGWGSVRASGLLYTLLGNVGVLGLCIFVAFYASLFLPFFSERWREVRDKQSDLLGHSLFAVTVLLFGLTLGGAEPMQPILWVLLGVATTAREVERPAYTARQVLLATQC